MAVYGGYYSSGISGSSGGPFTTYTSGAETYRVHTFLSSGKFKVDYPVRCDIFVVGGGGTGEVIAEGSHLGGGGAGGVAWVTGYKIMESGTYTVTVGAGGGIASNGSDSSLVVSSDTIVGKGGGACGYHAGAAASVGGSGGGGGHTQGGAAQNQTSQNGSLSSGTVSNYGSPGGTGVHYDPWWYCAGGGGGAAGSGSAVQPGQGGTGVHDFVDSSASDTTSFLAAASIGEVDGGYRYIAGGGGGTYQPNSAGGIGGGGRGGAFHTGVGAQAGTANTGGGGGGFDSRTSTTGVDGNGGSGVVIVRLGAL